ncbi:MAG: hypothetical protein PHC89_01245 [Candidatus Pacebacteria bacterium]|nr:hypothetical protein [Candidatus Paceibacterota bacterium]
MEPNTQTDLNIREALESFYDFSDYSSEDKERLLDESTDMIMEASLIRSLDRAGEATQEKFDALMETDPDADTVAKFIEENIPFFGEVLQEEFTIFQNIDKEAE